MKQDIQNIVEGNKLIALFDGWEIVTSIVKPSLWIEKYYDDCNHSINIIDVNGRVVDTSDNLQYHSSWDWLMPVVEKIEYIGYGFEIKGKFCYIRDYKKLKTIVSFTFLKPHEHSKIEATWQAVIQFIQWYNNQQKQVKE